MIVVQSLKRKISLHLLSNEVIKPIVIIMVWHLATKLSLFFMSYAALVAEPNVLVVSNFFLAVVYLISPLAGFLADVKYNRFKVLKCSTGMILIAVVSSLVSMTLFNMVELLDSYFYAIFVVFATAQIILACGNAMYLAIILPFGTDQIQDLPSKYTVYMLYAIFWSDRLGSFLTLGLNIPGHTVAVNTNKNSSIHFDSLHSILTEVCLSITAILLIIVLFLIRKKEEWISTRAARCNPYRLAYNVICFAVRQKKLIRRSAFTYCEDNCPSRLDFGKQRYGGPFTTEQVEDVKVLLNMVKVLLAAGSIFLLEIASKISTMVHYRSSQGRYKSYTNPAKIMLLDYEMMSPLLAIIFIPVYFCLIRLVLPSCNSSMFQRVSLSFLMQVLMFLSYLIFNSIASDRNERHVHIYLSCKGRNDLLSNHLISISGVYPLLLINILSFLYQMLSSIALWEFICSQSPQPMKGVLFGLFYAIRGLYQLLGMVISLLVFHYWNYTAINCQSGYNILHVVIGLCSLIMFALVSKSYRYRKRDDICNVYQYAEDYYSTDHQ